MKSQLGTHALLQSSSGGSRAEGATQQHQQQQPQGPTMNTTHKEHHRHLPNNMPTTQASALNKLRTIISVAEGTYKCV